mmetsp:Transcript_25270/g.52499  ORF Transcript_25270/g.52499 Transcript_25270/m.52499 type:complete len:134 (+) Transcript_25270:384-785(+)
MHDEYSNRHRPCRFYHRRRHSNGSSCIALRYYNATATVPASKSPTVVPSNSTADTDIDTPLPFTTEPKPAAPLVEVLLPPLQAQLARATSKCLGSRHPDGVLMTARAKSSAWPQVFENPFSLMLPLPLVAPLV